MAKFVLKNTKVLFEGRDISGELSNIALEYSGETPERTAFGDNSRRRLPGVLDVSVVHNGYWDAVSATDSLDEDLFNEIAAASGIMSFSPDGGTLGDIGFSFKSQAASYVPGATHGEVFAFVLNVSGDGPLIRGTVMENSVFTTTVNGTNRQLVVAAATDTLYSFVHVTAASGTSPTLDVTVESDDSGAFGTPTVQLTHPQFIAVGANLQSKVGPITPDDFYRLVMTITGGGPSFTVFGIIGIQKTLTP